LTRGPEAGRDYGPYGRYSPFCRDRTHKRQGASHNSCDCYASRVHRRTETPQFVSSSQQDRWHNRNCRASHNGFEGSQDHRGNRRNESHQGAQKGQGGQCWQGCDAEGSSIDQGETRGPRQYLGGRRVRDDEGRLRG